MTLSHLHADVRPIVQGTPEDRISFIREDHWIGYKAAKDILDELGQLIDYPKKIRMPCRMLIGDPDNGKSSLLDRCTRLHPNREMNGECCHVAVLIFETPPVPDEGRLYSQILKALRTAHREDSPPERLLAKVIDRFSELGIRLLMADEFHGMLNGSAAHQREFLASLKSLINTLRVSFVAAGLPEIAGGLAADGQFFTRFDRLELPKWGMNNESRTFLAGLEQILPLAEPSNLATDRDIAIAIITGSEGTIGGMTKLVTSSAIAAIRKGQEKITKEIVDEQLVFLRKRAVRA